MCVAEDEAAETASIERTAHNAIIGLKTRRLCGFTITVST
jgi:hypothetical protein